MPTIRPAARRSPIAAALLALLLCLAGTGSPVRVAAALSSLDDSAVGTPHVAPAAQAPRFDAPVRNVRRTAPVIDALPARAPAALHAGVLTRSGALAPAPSVRELARDARGYDATAPPRS